MYSQVPHLLQGTNYQLAHGESDDWVSGQHGCGGTWCSYYYFQEHAGPDATSKNMLKKDRKSLIHVLTLELIVTATYSAAFNVEIVVEISLLIKLHPQPDGTPCSCTAS